MKNVRMINAQHPNNAGEIIEGRPSPPKKTKRMV